MSIFGKLFYHYDGIHTTLPSVFLVKKTFNSSKRALLTQRSFFVYLLLAASMKALARS